MPRNENHRRVSIVFDEKPGKPVDTIDFFGHRITPLAGYDLEDIMIYIALTGLRYNGFRGHYATFVIHEISQFGLDAPFAKLQPGAILHASDAQATGDFVLHIGNGQFRSQDGRSFDPTFELMGDIFDYRLQRQRAGRIDQMTKLMQAETSQIRMMLALIDTALPAKDPKDALKRLRITYSRLVRIVDLGYPSGASGGEMAREAISNTWNQMTASWIIVPDHIHSPEFYTAGPELCQALARNIPDSFREVAKAAWNSIERAQTENLDRAAVARRGQTSGTSGHETLMIHRDLTRLDSAIEAAAPIEMLKPAAAKRQEKLRKTAA